MTATATPTNKEADRRIRPGDGKLNPVNHIVRIVVVPRSDSIDARESGGPAESHGLTNDELSAAEHQLKKKAAPPSPDGRAAPGESSDARSPTPKNMFEALKPTDIVVVGREPASVRAIPAPSDSSGVDSSGKPVSANPTKEGGQTASEPKPTRRLFAHDHHHADTVLRVWTESDTIEYQCDRRFEIVKVEKEGWKIYDAPDNPFGSGKVDYKAQERQLGTGKRQYFWTSSVLPATANNQQYKMTFKIFDENGKNGELVDPDIVCGNPPPSP